MSLFHPPAGFPPHLAYFWPMIWVQVLLLRAAVRAAYGRGVQYHWSIRLDQARSGDQSRSSR
ncbi:hypothetical protein, partial [Hyphomonas adhaerens]|uniref:hypothetical protein n=1 Tax=Hyphomonas adhaerens TaxID=81029 RepID=UPI002353A4C6